jgi:hypothetical protein
MKPSVSFCHAVAVALGLAAIGDHAAQAAGNIPPTPPLWTEPGFRGLLFLHDLSLAGTAERNFMPRTAAAPGDGPVKIEDGTNCKPSDP